MNILPEYITEKIPVELWGKSFAVLLFVVVLIFIFKKHIKNTNKWIVTAILFDYIFLVLSITLLREYELKGPQIILMPFESYKDIINGDYNLIAENSMNILMFFPLGFLLGLLYKFKSWKLIIIAGFSFSLFIETNQLIFQRGCFEIDDMINNTLGCILGYLVYLVIMKNWKYCLSIK